MEEYLTNGQQATASRRRQLREMLRGANAMAGLDLVDVRKAIARAPRKEPDAAGRTRRVGGNVATFLVHLILWEGSGELDDFWVHKTRREWFESEAALTESMVKTARRVAQEEGLVEFETDYRPSDRRPTTRYRANLWGVADVVNRSELQNVERQLEHEGRKRQRDRLNKKRRELERARNDLNLLLEQDSANPEPQLQPGQLRRQTRLSSPHYRRVQQENTSVDTDVSTPVGEDAEAGRITLKIYEHMKEAGYTLDHDEYSYNLAAVRRALDNDAPTADELDRLPAAFREYFEWRGGLDARKALRRMRQQAARSEKMAEQLPSDLTASVVTPRAGIEALRQSTDRFARKHWQLGLEWDLTQDRRPPTQTWLDFGDNGEERWKNWRRMQRIVREALGQEHDAEPEVDLVAASRASLRGMPGADDL